MVRRPREAPRSDVDVTGHGARSQRLRAQDQVDAQAEVAAKRAHAVIPPAEGALRLLEQAEGIVQPEVYDALERGPLGGRAMDPAFPRGRIVHVAVDGGDVEVADQQQLVVPLELARDLSAQRFEPR